MQLPYKPRGSFSRKRRDNLTSDKLIWPATCHSSPFEKRSCERPLRRNKRFAQLPDELMLGMLHRQHGAWRQPDNLLRVGAKDQMADSPAAMRSQHNHIHFKFLSLTDNLNVGPPRDKHTFSLDLSAKDALRERDWLLQVNATSLLGYHGPEQAEEGWRLVEDGLADLVASDGHRSARPPFLDAAYELVSSRVGRSAPTRSSRELRSKS